MNADTYQSFLTRECQVERRGAFIRSVLEYRAGFGLATPFYAVHDEQTQSLVVPDLVNPDHVKFRFFLQVDDLAHIAQHLRLLGFVVEVVGRSTEKYRKQPGITATLP